MALAQESGGLFGNRLESIELARRVLKESPEFTGAYFGYEPNADGNDADYLLGDEADKISGALDKNGRFIPYWYRGKKDNTEILLEPLVDMETSLYYQGVKDLYLKAGEPTPMVTEPYVYEGKMIVEQTYPIVIDGKFQGIAGVDRSLSDITLFTEQIKRRESVDILLISRSGRFISTTIPKQDELITREVKNTIYAQVFDAFLKDFKKPSFELVTEPADVDWDHARNVVIRLEDLLAEHNAGAIDFFEKSASILRAALGQAAASVEDPVTSWDFSRALEALRAAKADCEQLQ